MNDKKRGFTLVELLVVITIISILSTIGYVSFQGYSTEARNSKRKSDISSLRKTVELNKIKGTSLISMVKDDSSTIQQNIQIAGYTGTGGFIDNTNYKAGNPNFIVMKLNESNFKDPSSGDFYKIGSELLGNQFEIAASIENNGDISSYVSGTWNPRTSLNTRAERESIDGNIFYMTDESKDSHLLRVRDRVRIGSVSTVVYTIKKIKGNMVVLDQNIAPGNTGDNLYLNKDETRHLIKRHINSDYAIKEDSGDSYAPYSLQ